MLPMTWPPLKSDMEPHLLHPDPRAIRDLRDLFTERLVRTRRTGVEVEARAYRQALRDLHEQFTDLLSPRVRPGFFDRAVLRWHPDPV